MKLPRAEAAVVDPAKIRDYLLSTEHPVGRFKEVFFGALGYTDDEFERLRQDLLALAAADEATLGQASDFGQKYEVRGEIRGPSGRSAEIVTVWIVLAGEDSPRFVTAFPG